MYVFLHCYGTDCPLKEKCLRYKTKINPKKQYHLGNVPYSHLAKKCGFFIGIKGENIESQIEFYLQAHENGEDHHAI